MIYFDFKDNNSTITLSAPHGSNVYPDNNTSREPGDRGTKELVIKMAEILECNYIVSNFSRTFVDFNRSKSNCILKSFGENTFNKDINESEIARRKEIHSLYFKKLGFLCKDMHLSIHSMNEVGGNGAVDEGKKRKDIVLSDLEGKSCNRELTSKLKTYLEKEGFDVSLNKPFKGGYEVAFCSTICCSLQLEIRKDFLLSGKQNLFIDKQKVNDMALKLTNAMRFLER